jgi:phage baseplate assembly protein gpV
MDRFMNIVKAHAAALDRGQGQPRFGLVASVDPQRYAVRVSLQPEGVLSGWLPVLSAWVGAGWGMVCLPQPGDQVLVLAQDGEAEHGVVAGAAFSDRARPPEAPVGELWLVHRTGASLRLAEDGTVRVHGDLHVEGSVFATGEVADGHGSLARLRGVYDAHTHPPGGNAASPQD